MENTQAGKSGKEWPEAPLDLIDCHRLVGCFFDRWAQLETRLDVAIRRILQIEQLAMAILSVNLTMAAKLYCARCAVAMYGDHDDQWQKTAQKVIIDIGKMSEKRNMIAHTAFNVSDDEAAVEFQHIKARSKIELPDELWTPDEFSTKMMEMAHLGSELERVMNEAIAVRTKIDLRQKKVKEDMARALMGQGPPPGGNWYNALFGVPSTAPVPASDE